MIPIVHVSQMRVKVGPYENIRGSMCSGFD